MMDHLYFIIRTVSKAFIYIFKLTTESINIDFSVTKNVSNLYLVLHLELDIERLVGSRSQRNGLTASRS